MPALDEPIALITGIAGQDGGYLLRELIAHGRKVFGVDIHITGNVDHLSKAELIGGNVSYFGVVWDLIRKVRPDEVYHLAADSFVATSWTDPARIIENNAFSLLYILDACREIVPKCRIYQASSSEMHGNARNNVQNESASFRPASPYGASKVLAHNLARIHRESYGQFVACGIAHNHCGPTRPERFVTRKVTKGAARIYRAMKEDKTFDPLHLGNLDAKRDWSYVGDIVRAMRLIIEADAPDDWVIASGKARSVRQLCEAAFGHLDMEISWEGKDLQEKGFVLDHEVICVDPEFFRPNDLDYLCGDASKIRKELGWQPTVSFSAMISEMVQHDLDLLRSGR